MLGCFCETTPHLDTAGLPQQGGGVPEQYDRLMGEAVLFISEYERNYLFNITGDHS